MPINQSDGRTTNSTAAVKNMTSHPLYTVDVFSQRKYTGNQLAVVDEAHRLSPDVMQQIAQEMNYSETTFITDPKPSEAGHRVRIFTPQTELPFAGHPTLGTAFVIREYVIDGEPNEIVLNLDVGSIRVTIEQNDMGQDIYWMEQQPQRSILPSTRNVLPELLPSTLIKSIQPTSHKLFRRASPPLLFQ